MPIRIASVPFYWSFEQRRQMKWVKTTNLVLVMGGSAVTAAAILVSSSKASALPSLSGFPSQILRLDLDLESGSESVGGPDHLGRGSACNWRAGTQPRSSVSADWGLRLSAGRKSGVRGRPNPCGGGRESCCLSSHAAAAAAAAAPAPRFQLPPM